MADKQKRHFKGRSTVWASEVRPGVTWDDWLRELHAKTDPQLTQAQLAARMGLTEGSISGRCVVLGLRRMPKPRKKEPGIASGIPGKQSDAQAKGSDTIKAKHRGITLPGGKVFKGGTLHDTNKVPDDAPDDGDDE